MFQGQVYAFSIGAAGDVVVTIGDAPPTSLGGIVTSPPLGVVLGESLYVIARGQDFAMWARTADSAGQWFSLGGIVLEAEDIYQVSGEIYVTVIGLDGGPWWSTLDDDGDWQSGVPPFLPVPTPVPDTCTTASPCLASSTVAYAGQTYSFSLDDSGEVIATAGDSQGITLDGLTATSNPVGLVFRGRLFVFARGSDYAMWVRIFDEQDTRWYSLGGICTAVGEIYDVGDGTIYLNVTGTDNGPWWRTLMQSWQSGAPSF